MIESEVVLPRRACAQPRPSLAPGGDCAACVLGGVCGLSVPDVYTLLCEGKVQSTSRWGQRDALYAAQRRGLIDRFVDEVPFWPNDGDQAVWGSPGWAATLPWFEYVRMAIDAGYYGIASINFAGMGPFSASDHAVLICGARFRWSDPDSSGSRSGVEEIFVSCSASCPEGSWHKVRHFLKERGGYNAMWVRPTQ